MVLSSYPVRCTVCTGCAVAEEAGVSSEVRLAAYKIAGRWSDGIIEELKTYALCCEACLTRAYSLSRSKQSACRLAPGETLEVLGIYELVRGKRDRELVRRHDLERAQQL